MKRVNLKRVKICGITDRTQATAIAEFGASALGFICVESSPRYVTPARLGAIAAQLPPNVARVGVFANARVEDIAEIAGSTGLTAVQLHGDESPSFCRELRQLLPEMEFIKAIRVKDAGSLKAIARYGGVADSFLLDAYHPQRLGGTGRQIEPGLLANVRCPSPWLLAGGLTPENAVEAIAQTRPDGIDLSSGVEIAPGNKDLGRVSELFARLRAAGRWPPGRD